MPNISIQTGGGYPGGGEGTPVSAPADISDPTLLDRIEALESSVAALQAANVAFLAATFAADIAALEAADVVIESDIDDLEAVDTALGAADSVHTADITALEAVNAAEDAFDADPEAFFSFGPSENIKNQRLQGYDRESDSLLASSGVAIENLGDAPNIWMRRREQGASATGFSDNTQIGRIGAVPLSKVGGALDYLWDNGTDGEMAHIIFRLHLEDDGETAVGGHSRIEFFVVNSRDTDPAPVPFQILELTGLDGGKIIYHGIEANGDPITIVLAQPTT